MQITLTSVWEKRPLRSTTVVMRLFATTVQRASKLWPEETRYETTSTAKREAASSTETLHARSGELLTVICKKDVPLHPPFSSSPQKIPNTNRNDRQSQPSRHAKRLVSTHRCKVNHAVASQSVILSLLLRGSDKPVAKACVKGL
jgi:hypothetical protein